MARAIVVSERQPDASWKPTVVFLATRARVDAKALPGDTRRDAWLTMKLATIRRGSGDWEAWVDEGLYGMANGHDTWAEEVEPELTVEALYQREVLGTTPRSLAPEALQPATSIPDGLGGYRKLREGSVEDDDGEP